jgi:hypothetical protein
MQASDTHDVARADDDTNLCQLQQCGLGDGDGTDGDDCARIRCGVILYICTGWESNLILAYEIPEDDAMSPILC